MLFGAKIRDARQERKLTQTELAEMVGVTRQTIGLIEAGRYNPSLKLCIDLAIALDRTLDELFWFGERLQTLLQFKHILITDVGSTTTKALLLVQEAETFKFLTEVNVPTTVEKPHEDVKIGLMNAIAQLEAKTGVSIKSTNGSLKIPFLTTSSAGGGLQIMVFGVTSVETGRVAEMTAYGAGGVILKTFTIDDGIPPIHKMRLIHELHPDLILLAGGVEDGNIHSIVRLSEILTLANPTPKFVQSEKIPLVYAGNSKAQPFVSDVLSRNFHVHPVENVRPSMTEMNIEPARHLIHELFMDNVMERAPGYAEIKKWVKKPIIPTPTGVEKILKIYGEQLNKNVVMVDIGGATTDIFTNILGDAGRTVAANIGLSYSIANVIAQAGIEPIAANVPGSISVAQIRNYAANKMLNPSYLPTHEGEFAIEHAMAIAGVQIAWKQHQDMNFKAARIGFLDRMHNRTDFDPFQEVFQVRTAETTFQVSDIDLIIGAGGVMPHARTREQAIRMLVEGFMPAGITRLAIDKSFKSPHLGVLSTIDEELALTLFRENCLHDLAYVVAPTGNLVTGQKAIGIKDESSDLGFTVNGGDVLYLNRGGDLSLTLAEGLNLYKNMREFKLKSDLPVLIDCRGRGQKFIGKPLLAYDIPGFSLSDIIFETALQPPAPKIEEGEYRFTRELPYPGEILVEPGTVVNPDTIVGHNVYTPPRIYMIDIQQLIGYDHHLSDQDWADGLLVKVGDMVQVGDRIFKIKPMLEIIGNSYCHSQVRGKVLRIENNRLILLEEIQDYSLQPYVVDVARFLKVKPKHIRGYLKFQVGDYVQRGQVLLTLSPEKLPLKSPATGTIKEINTETGTMTIQYDVTPVPLPAFVPGRVDRITESTSVDIIGEGTIVHGQIGFGHEHFGLLSLLPEHSQLAEGDRNKVVATAQPIDLAFLRRAKQVGVAGIIAPSIDNTEWVAFSGQEIGVGLTGDEDIPFTVILTEGFGQWNLPDALRQVFERMTGKTASLSGRTQIRAGVTRPMIIFGQSLN